MARVNGILVGINEERMALAALEGGHIPVRSVKIAQAGAVGAQASCVMPERSCLIAQGNWVIPQRS